MAYTFDDMTVSDLHKDARNCRPSQYWWSIWMTSTDDEKQAIWDSLLDEMDQELIRERRAQERAIDDFEENLQLIISAGAGDRDTAIRWMTQTESFQHEQDVEHWVWNLGLLFTDLGRELVTQVNNMYRNTFRY